MKPDHTRRRQCAICTWSAVLMISSLSAATALMGQNARDDDTADLRTQADEIRASADSLFKLRRIPWVTDPADGFRLAQAENRPVFFYLQAGDPLEDC